MIVIFFVLFRFNIELYSSQTSSSFPASDGTVHSYIGGKSSIRKDKSSRNVDDKTKKNGKPSSNCSYQCQFCDKSFPRLGYLKKHEQVSYNPPTDQKLKFRNCL